METDYTMILEAYPEVISMDQLYRICHISKRKARWLLEHGIIPCEDSGKKTRRFKIKTKDVIDYLNTAEHNLQTIMTPIGIFTNNRYKENMENPIAYISVHQFTRYLHSIWCDAPDALKVNDIARLTGYRLQTINHWLDKHSLRYIQCPDGKIVAKKWVVDFIAVYIVKNPNRLSDTLAGVVSKYLKTLN